ncbi:hypothetical protein COB72_10940 [bacterium]|nr:MAG: hypothetical protein COB72_10940 [bacterium]
MPTDSNRTPALADALPRVFIVGCQKSGTTWMQGLLGAHPQICCRGEACFGNFLAAIVSQALSKYNTMQRAGPVNVFDNDDGVEIVRHAACVLQRKWVAASKDPAAVQVIAEKTPEHALALDVLEQLFPTMRVIHIIRDGRDGVISGWHHNIRDNETNFRARFPTQSDYTRYFVESHWLSYIAKARAWGAAHQENYYELQYEHALEDPFSKAKALFEFLDVAADDETIQKAVETSSFKKMSGGRDSGQVDNKSHVRKGVAGGWKNELDDESVRIFEEIGGGVLTSLGYPLSTAPVG